ncbi:MAG: PEP-CTERM sorting domain-containing protein [Cyanophyceae cyanobacterium]
MKALSLLTSAAIAGGLALSLAGQASATTFKFDWEKADGGGFQGKSAVTGKNQNITVNHNNGYYESVSTTFDDITDEFVFSAAFSDKNGNTIAGGWVVIRDGPNPKGQGEEYAIFYLDGASNTATGYAYNGQNRSDSWSTNSDNYLGSWDMSYDSGNGESSLSFSLDATDINARTDIDPDWKGVTFGKQVGVWFHAGYNTSVSYDADGKITNFSSEAAWFDTNALDTEAVPEPTALLGLGLVGGAFAVSRRRKNGQLAEGSAESA